MSRWRSTRDGSAGGGRRPWRQPGPAGGAGSGRIEPPYPEYDAYEQETASRRGLAATAVGLLLASGLAGTYFVMAGGLGALLPGGPPGSDPRRPSAPAVQPGVPVVAPGAGRPVAATGSPVPATDARVPVTARASVTGRPVRHPVTGGGNATAPGPPAVTCPCPTPPPPSQQSPPSYSPSPTTSPSVPEAVPTSAGPPPF